MQVFAEALIDNLQRNDRLRMVACAYFTDAAPTGQAQGQGVARHDFNGMSLASSFVCKKQAATPAGHAAITTDSVPQSSGKPLCSLNCCSVT